MKQKYTPDRRPSGNPDHPGKHPTLDRRQRVHLAAAVLEIGYRMLLMFIAAALAPEAPGYSVGPFNLVLRWGEGSPVVIRYSNRERCEMAALSAFALGDAEVNGPGRPDTPPAPEVSGVNRPYGFCIPG